MYVLTLYQQNLMLTNAGNVETIIFGYKSTVVAGFEGFCAENWIM